MYVLPIKTSDWIDTTLREPIKGNFILNNAHVKTVLQG